MLWQTKTQQIAPQVVRDIIWTENQVPCRLVQGEISLLDRYISNRFKRCLLSTESIESLQLKPRSKNSFSCMILMR